MKQSDKHNKNVRRCGRCGYEDDQSRMVRVSKRLSDSGWLCSDCYEDAKYAADED